MQLTLMCTNDLDVDGDTNVDYPVFVDALISGSKVQKLIHH